MTIQYVHVDLEPTPRPAAARQNPKLEPRQTQGKVYDLSTRSRAEIAAEQARAQGEAKTSKASAPPERRADPRDPSDIRRLVEESQTAPENLLGLNVKAFGVEVPGLHYGTVSAKVAGTPIQLPGGGPAVTVNGKGEITSVKYRGMQITQDGRGIVKFTLCGVNVTAAVAMGRAAKMGGGAAVKAVLDSGVGQTLQNSSERIEAGLRKSGG